MDYKIRVTFVEPVLGGVAKNPEIYKEFIASKASDAVDDELETIEELEQKSGTGFHRENGHPIFYNYIIKGFLKEACSSMRDVDGSEAKKLKNYKKRIDGLIFVNPRRIVLHPSGEIYKVERPLRGQTAQGERISLASSEALPAGTWFDCTITTLGNTIDEKLLKELLDYGQFKGLGQWRNSSYGQFTWDSLIHELDKDSDL